jgi:hypothetical protein
MAWDALRWWISHRHELRGERFRAAAAPVDELIDEVVAALTERLARGGGVIIRELPQGREVLQRADVEGAATATALVRAIERWPRGAERPHLHTGPRLLGVFLDEVLAHAVLSPLEITAIVRRVAALRPSLEPMEGLLSAVEATVRRGVCPPDLPEALRELRHGLPLEARASRRRVQALLRDAESLPRE